MQGSIIIRTNGVHTLNFQLQNTQRKYDGVLQPMDRITVELKRVTWVRVFSGYLNNGPVFSAWPRVLSMSASCTLKRLQFWYWDPTTSAASKLITGSLQNHPQAGAGNTAAQQSPVAAGAAGSSNLKTTMPMRRGLIVGDNPVIPGQTPGQTQTEQQQPGPAPTPGTAAVNPTPQAAPQGAPAAAPAGTGTPAPDQQFDDSVKGAVIQILNAVVAWPMDRIHIASIPDAWVKLASEVGNLILKDNNVQGMLGDLSKGDQSTGQGGTYAGGSGPAPPGQINDWILAALQLLGYPPSYAAGIYHQIMHESHGDPTITQGNIGDINNATGNLARGIMQVTPTTFAQWALPGHTDILNPVDNIAAGSKYAMAKYGPSWFNDGPQHEQGY